MKTKNLVLIGMPGSGKSTLGKRLARETNLQFLDTDALIERRYGFSLQHILNNRGSSYVRAIEEDTLCSLQLENHVIATGGSAVYSTRAMQYLQSIGLMIYLHISLPTLLRRVKNTDSRGLLKLPSHSLPRLYRERLPLYQHWSQVNFENNRPLSAWQLDNLLRQINS